MKNLILDVDIILDVLAGKTSHALSSAEPWEDAVRHGYRLWVVAATLPAMIRAIEQGIGQRPEDVDGTSDVPSVRGIRQALKNLLAPVEILSSYAFEAKDVLDGGDPEKTFILRAADTLGGETLILSRDQTFMKQDDRVISPEAFLRLLSISPDPDSLPFIDLKAQQAHILPALEERIRGVLRHGQYILGPEIRELEEKLADYAGVHHAITCSSGTDALLMGLMAYGVGPGDAVFTSPFTFIATAEVISLVGATPVFVDIDPQSFNMDPEFLSKAVQAVREGDPGIHVLPRVQGLAAKPLRPKGIIAVDLFGLPADYRKINAIAKEQGLFVIEDAAQSFGAEYHGRKACSLAPVGCTSFFPAKPLGCYGDGGAIFTDDEELAKKMDSIRVHGMRGDKNRNARIGLNARMDTLQAAVLLPKLELLPSELEARNRVADRYTERLASNRTLVKPRVPSGLKSAWAQYSILSDLRQAIQDALRTDGIPSVVYYPTPLHLQTAFAGLGYGRGDFPVSERVSQRILSLPMHPYLSEREIDRITNIISRAAGGAHRMTSKKNVSDPHFPS